MTTAKPTPAIWRGQRQETAQAPAAGEASPPLVGRPAGLVAGIEQRQAEHARLLALCQQLREQHRCPGRCVFGGELHRDGLAVFRDELGSAR